MWGAQSWDSRDWGSGVKGSDGTSNCRSGVGSRRSGSFAGCGMRTGEFCSASACCVLGSNPSYQPLHFPLKPLKSTSRLALHTPQMGEKRPLIWNSLSLLPLDALDLSAVCWWRGRAPSDPRPALTDVFHVAFRAGQLCAAELGQLGFAGPRLAQSQQGRDSCSAALVSFTCTQRHG